MLKFRVRYSIFDCLLFFPLFSLCNYFDFLIYIFYNITKFFFSNYFSGSGILFSVTSRDLIFIFLQNFHTNYSSLAALNWRYDWWRTVLSYYLLWKKINYTFLCKNSREPNESMLIIFHKYIFRKVDYSIGISFYWFLN